MIGLTNCTQQQQKQPLTKPTAAAKATYYRTEHTTNRTLTATPLLAILSHPLRCTSTPLGAPTPLIPARSPISRAVHRCNRSHPFHTCNLPNPLQSSAVVRLLSQHAPAHFRNHSANHSSFAPLRLTLQPLQPHSTSVVVLSRPSSSSLPPAPTTPWSAAVSRYTSPTIYASFYHLCVLHSPCHNRRMLHHCLFVVSVRLLTLTSPTPSRTSGEQRTLTQQARSLIGMMARVSSTNPVTPHSTNRRMAIPTFVVDCQVGGRQRVREEAGVLHEASVGHGRGA